ncbi:MAG: transporter substrate-binding domain-containing protein [Bacteroidales bacterium]
MNKYKRKRFLLIYIFIIALAVTAMVSIINCSWSEKPTRDYKDIISDTLKIVTNLHSLTELKEINSVSGFDYELAVLIGKESGMNYKIIIENSLEKSLKRLNENKCDIVARPIIVSAINKNKYLFAGNMRDDKLVLIQRKKEFNNSQSVIETPMNLGKKEIHVIDDESIYMIINHLATETGDSIYICKEPKCGVEQLAIMVADSVIDYAVGDYSIAKKLSKYLPQIDIKTTVSFSMLHAWGIRKSSPALKDSLDNWFMRIKERNEFKNLLNKYNIDPIKQ